MVNHNCIYLSPVICLCLLEGNNLGGLCRWTTALCWGILCWWHRRFLWLGQYTKKTPLGTSWRGGAKAVSGRHTGRWGHQHICNNNAHYVVTFIFIGRFPSFSKRRQSLFRVNSRTCRHKIQTSSLLILVFIYCKSETDQKWSQAPSFLDLGPEEASVYPFFAAVAGAGFLWPWWQQGVWLWSSSHPVHWAALHLHSQAHCSPWWRPTEGTHSSMQGSPVYSPQSEI